MKFGDKKEMSSRAYCGWFNFKGADQQKKVGLLSGGERNRVHLAKMLKEGGNLLLLDEPTNDLDTETLGALEAALEDFPGCAVVISHDRFFLDRLATHILAFEGDSHVEWFEGNFEAYEEDKKRRLGEAAVEPHRIKFKRFERLGDCRPDGVADWRELFRGCSFTDPVETRTAELSSLAIDASVESWRVAAFF